MSSDPDAPLFGAWHAVARVGNADWSYLPAGCRLDDVTYRPDHTFTIYEFDVAYSGSYTVTRDGDYLNVSHQTTSFDAGLNCITHRPASALSMVNSRARRYRVESGALVSDDGSRPWSGYTRLAPGEARPLQARTQPLPAPEGPPDSDCTLRLTNPIFVTVDGDAFIDPRTGGVSGPIMHVLLIGFGRFIVAEEPFPGSAPVEHVRGSGFEAMIGGHAFSLASAAPEFACAPDAHVHVRFDPLQEASRLPLADIGLGVGVSGTVNIFGAAYQIRKAAERRAALAARRQN